MRGLGSRGVADVTRLFTMSISDLLDRWFESEQMKTIMMVDGLIGQWAGPDEPGTAYVLLHHAIGGVGGESARRQLGVPAGRDGRGVRGHPRIGRGVRRGDPHRVARRTDPHPQRTSDGRRRS